MTASSLKPNPDGAGVGRLLCDAVGKGVGDALEPTLDPGVDDGAGVVHATAPNETRRQMVAIRPKRRRVTLAAPHDRRRE
jgi:hypothetical protein